MKSEDLGFDRKTGRHDAGLTYTEDKFVEILWEDHTGFDNRISANDLARKFIFKLENKPIALSQLEYWKRDVRRMHNHLLTYHDNIPILSRAGIQGGYWFAQNKLEAAMFYDTFRKRGMTGLLKASRGKQSVMVDIVEQLSFKFDDLIDKTDTRYPQSRELMSIKILDAFLERMTKNPEKFADGLRKLGKKYGSVLLPREQVTAMRAKARELQQMVDNLV